MASPLRESINLNGLDLSLFKFSAAGNIRGTQSNDNETNVAQVAGEPVDVSEEALNLDTFHLGFGYSWRLIQGSYAWAENADARFPRLLLPGPYMNVVAITADGPPRCGQDFAGNFYVGAGRYIFQVPSGTGAPTQVRDLGAGQVAWSMDTFLSKLYVGTSAGQTASSAPGPLQELSGTTWTGGGPNRKAIAHAWYQASATGVTGNWQLIGSDSLSSVANCATGPMTPGNWGASVTVGDSTYPITSLVSDQGHIYVNKTNGLHDVDGVTGFTPNLMPFFEQALDDDNGVSSISANGSIYSGQLAGLFRLDTSGGSTTGRITAVTPGHGLPNETPVRGKITAMTSYGPWVIAAVYNGTDTHIMWGRDIRQGDAGTSPFGYGAGYGPSPQAIGPSPMLWHGALIFLPGKIVRMLAISGLTSPPRLWLGTWDGSTAALQWCTIARTENPAQDPEYRFATSWALRLAGQDWEHPVTGKDLLQVDIEVDNLGVGSQIDIQTSIDGGPLQDYGIANMSPQSSVIGTADVFGRRIGLCLHGSNQTTSPPMVRALRPRAQLRPQLRRIRTYDVILAEGGVDRFGGRDIERPHTTYQQLEPLQMQGRVALRDEFGMHYQVLVLPPIQRRVIHLGGESGRGTAEPTIVATLNLKLLMPDRDPTVIPKANWDDGHKWDTGVIWGAP